MHDLMILDNKKNLRTKAKEFRSKHIQTKNKRIGQVTLYSTLLDALDYVFSCLMT